MAISSTVRSGISTFAKYQKTTAGTTVAGGTTFVLAGNGTSSTAYATSSDGITWTLRSNNGMGQSVGLSKIGNAFYNSRTDYATWAIVDPVSGTSTRVASHLSQPNNINASVNGVGWTNNSWATWGSYGFSWNGLSYYDSSGTTYKSLVFGNNTWTYIKDFTPYYFASTTQEKYPTGIAFNAGTCSLSVFSIGFADGLFVASGTGGIASSTDGITWTTRSTAGDFRTSKVIKAGALWFCGINGGAFYTSPDGITWTSRSTMSGSLIGAAYGNGVWTVLSSGGSLFSSPDGTTWTARTNVVPGTNWNSSYDSSPSVLAFG